MTTVAGDALLFSSLILWRDGRLHADLTILVAFISP